MLELPALSSDLIAQLLIEEEEVKIRPSMPLEMIMYLSGRRQLALDLQTRLLAMEARETEAEPVVQSRDKYNRR
jgi:hypothetical protein